MKLKIAVASFIFFILFVSCSHNASDRDSGNATLKATATVLDSSTTWTDSLEGELLSENLSKVEGISSRMQVSSEMFPLSEPFLQGKKNYPAISGAYSLDTSELPEHCFNAINGFLEAFEKGEGLESFFETSGIYSLVMFQYDFQRLYGDMKVSWHVIGEPFCGEGYFQCPVRLFFEEGKVYNGAHADAMIFLRNSDSGTRIISLDLISQTGE